MGNISLYNTTQYVQEHTLVNRGLIDIGGCAIPHSLKSNNKTEALERLAMSSVYFGLSFLTPLVLLPIFNKQALKKHGIVKNFKNNERKIIRISNEFLNKDSHKMESGIKQLGENLGCKNDFQNILARFPNKEKLRESLIKAHKDIIRKDFLSTAWMWCATPYIITGLTEKITKRKGFSATFNMKKDNEISNKEYEHNKHLKMVGSSILATLPGLIIPPIIAKGIKNPNLGNKFFKLINKNAKSFDYGFEVNMSKTLFSIIWLTSSYPSKILSSRDKDERKDRALRDGALIGMYFGGDFLINNILGRLSDRILKTKIIDRSANKGKTNFFKNFRLPLKNFRTVAKDLAGESPKIIKRTQNAGAAIYWASLLTNMGLIGFGLPTILNKILKKSINNEISHKSNVKNIHARNNVFDKMKNISKY